MAEPTGPQPATTPTPSPAASPAAAGTPPPAAAPPSSPPSTEPSQPFTTPADDYQQKYADAERALKDWGSLGMDPQAVRQTLDYTRAITAALQSGMVAQFDKNEGKIKFVPPQSSEPTSSPSDPLAGLEDLPPREMVAKLRELIVQDLTGTVKTEAEQARRLLEDGMRNLSGREQLFMTAARLAQQHPDVSFEDLVAEATRMSAMTPTDLLQAALNAKLSPKQQEALIAQRVQEALAAEQQKRENDEAQLLAPKMSPYMTRIMTSEQEQKDLTPLQRRMKSKQQMIARIREITRKAG